MSNLNDVIRITGGAKKKLALYGSKRYPDTLLDAQ